MLRSPHSRRVLSRPGREGQRGSHARWWSREKSCAVRNILSMYLAHAVLARSVADSALSWRRQSSNGAQSNDRAAARNKVHFINSLRHLQPAFRAALPLGDHLSPPSNYSTSSLPHPHACHFDGTFGFAAAKFSDDNICCDHACYNVKRSVLQPPPYLRDALFSTVTRHSHAFSFECITVLTPFTRSSFYYS